MEGRSEAQLLAIRIFGAFNLALGASMLLLVRANRYAAAHGGHDLTILAEPAAVLVVVGVCLIACRRWSVAAALGIGVAVLAQGAIFEHEVIECIYGVSIAGTCAYFLLKQGHGIDAN
jgi:hypothetical protein